MISEVTLEGVNFNVKDFHETEQDGKRAFDFTLNSLGDREYYLVKEILSKKDLVFKSDEQNEINVRVSSHGYKVPNELSNFTEVDFSVSLIEKTENESLSTDTGLTIEAFRLNQVINAIVELAKEKNLFSQEELDNQLRKMQDQTAMDEYKKFFKRVFNVDMEEED